VLQASGNRQLGNVSRQLRLPVIMSRVSALLTPQTLARSLAEHRDIAQAILAGEPVASEQLMQEHLRCAAELTNSASDSVGGR